MSVHSFQFVHVNSFMPIRSCQFMRFKSCVSIPLGQFPHVGSFVSIRSCHFLHVNSFMSIDSCQFIHFMHCISFQFTSFQAAMNSNKPCLFFEISAPARAGHYLVQPMHGDLRDVFLFTQINVYIYIYTYIYIFIYISYVYVYLVTIRSADMGCHQGILRFAEVNDKSWNFRFPSVWGRNITWVVKYAIDFLVEDDRKHAEICL